MPKDPSGRRQETGVVRHETRYRREMRQETTEDARDTRDSRQET